MAALVMLLAVASIGCSRSPAVTHLTLDDPLGVGPRLLQAEERVITWRSCAHRSDRHDEGRFTVTATSGAFLPSGDLGIEWRAVQRDGSQPPIRSVLVADGDDALQRRTSGGAAGGLEEWREPSWPRPAMPHPDRLLTLEALVESRDLTVDDAIAVPGSGGAIRRIEGLPTWEGIPDTRLLDVPDRNVVWAIDAFVDDDGSIDRLRAMTEAWPTQWTEVVIDRSGRWTEPDPSDCPAAAGASTPGWNSDHGWQATLTPPLDVELDETGRPYDSVRWSDSIERRDWTELVLPSGELLVIDGNQAEWVVADGTVEGSPVRFADELITLDVDVIWERSEYGEVPLGVRLDVPETSVDRWLAFEFAYGTDGGMGGVVSGSLVGIEPIPDPPDELTSLDFDTPFYRGEVDLEQWDLDGTPGNDLLRFSNGFGDGGFPMIRGIDRDDRLVSLIIWDTRFPWRLAVPDGQPPPDVSDREEELLECLGGRRDPGPDGSCPSDL